MNIIYWLLVMTLIALGQTSAIINLLTEHGVLGIAFSYSLGKVQGTQVKVSDVL